jgi:signal transduction histidine kinase
MPSMLEALISLFAPQRLGLNVVATAVVILAVYTAFCLACKPAPSRRTRYPWLIGAGVAMGCGAWAAYLIMLLGYSPAPPFALAFGPILSSLIIGIVGCTLGLVVACNHDLQIGGAMVGTTIAGAFYTGMLGVEFAASKSWNPSLVFASFVLSASCGTAALTRGHLSPDIRGRLLGMVMLGVGTVGTFVIGFSALSLRRDPNLILSTGTNPAILLAASLTAVVMLIMGLGFVGVLVDRYVDDIEQARDTLEERVGQRTLELSEAKKRSEDAAQAADMAARAKAEFVAGLSHELRTPLNAILGFSDLIAKAAMGALDSHYKDYGSEIHASGQHLLSLVNEILDLSKLESGRFELHLDHVPISEVLDACRSMLVGLARDAGVTLSIEEPHYLRFVSVDPQRLRQILVNLLSNAIKFTPEGGKVSLTTTRSANSALIIKVRDNGIGMSTAGIAKALEPFGQIDGPTNRKWGGTGLGLTLVDHLVRLHGGSMKIYSKPNLGTTVVICFPPDGVISQAAA